MQLTISEGISYCFIWYDNKLLPIAIVYILCNVNLRNQIFPFRGNLFNSSVAGGWCIPFIGSDKSVITRTQMYNFQFKNERPVSKNLTILSKRLFTQMTQKIYYTLP